jgi:hypothetical protein
VEETFLTQAAWDGSHQANREAMEALADLDRQEPNVAAADTPRVLTERATLALRESSPPQVQIDTNPTFLGPEPAGTPRGDQKRAWAEALDCPTTTQTEPNNSRPRQWTLPASTNRSAAPPP